MKDIGKILIIGVGNAGSNVVEEMSKDNIPNVNYLKIVSECLDSNIPTIELNEDKESLVTAWKPEALKEYAEKKKEEIEEAIINGLK